MRYIVLAVLLSFGISEVSAQEVYSSTGRPISEKKVSQRQKGFDASRIIFGGGFGFGFGNVTNVSVSPIVGYRISDNFSAGIGFGYQYVRVKDYWALNEPSTNAPIYKPYVANMYSPSLWTRYVIWNNIFAHVEFEYNIMVYKEYYNNYTNWPGTIETRNINYKAPSLLIGGGIRQPLSDRVSLVFQGLYDVIQDKYSPYKGTIVFRFGVAAGF